MTMPRTYVLGVTAILALASCGGGDEPSAFCADLRAGLSVAGLIGQVEAMGDNAAGRIANYVSDACPEQIAQNTALRTYLDGQGIDVAEVGAGD